MAVTLISNPLGHKLAPTINDATISNSSGDALVTHSATVTNGQWVYIESNFERYSGFKYVVYVGPTSFKIRDSAAGDNIDFIQEGDITFQISALDHSWQSVHLPIVYELESSRFPTNNDFTPTAIDDSINYNGYTEITSPGTFTDPEVLEYVTLIGDGDLAGPHQIIAVIGPDDIVLDIAFDAAVDFTIYTAVPYYNNYFVEVEVYSGLESGHRWVAEKPSEKVAVLRLIPDTDNRVKFSIAEVIKGSIKTRNNLTLDTLPNNLDFYTQFHINWRECFDAVDEDGNIFVSRGGLIEDTFIGNAVNSMMPFKSLNQSFMSDYLYSPGQLARWLTLQDRPVAVVGHFFDLSFLNYYESDLVVTIFKGTNGVVTATEIIDIENPGSGVVRIPFTPESGYDLYCVQISDKGGSQGLDLSAFTNGGSGVNWTTGVNPSVSLTSPPVISKVISAPYSFIDGEEYTITFHYNAVATLSLTLVSIGAFDSSFNSVDVDSSVFSTTGSKTATHTFTATSTMTRIGMTGRINSGFGSSSITITSIVVESVPVDITEQICIDIIPECGSTFTNDNVRITENGYFRELE